VLRKIYEAMSPIPPGWEKQVTTCRFPARVADTEAPAFIYRG